MTYQTIQTILNADVLCGGEHLDRIADSAFACDFMSDVLAMAKGSPVLLTGMINPQVVRTAQMLDIGCIVFVRGKKPGEDVIALAKEGGQTVLTTSDLMFDACGKLYAAGLAGDR